MPKCPQTDQECYNLECGRTTSICDIKYMKGPIFPDSPNNILPSIGTFSYQNVENSEERNKISKRNKSIEIISKLFAKCNNTLGHPTMSEIVDELISVNCIIED